MVGNISEATISRALESDVRDFEDAVMAKLSKARDWRSAHAVPGGLKKMTKVMLSVSVRL